MKIAFIGIGNVGFAIANRLQKLGHDIIIASNNESSDSVQKALANNASFKMAPIQAAIDQSDFVFLATPFQVNQNILDGLRFDGKTLVDCTNSVGAGITHGLKSINIPFLFSEYLAIHIIVKKRRRSEERRER